MHDVLTTGPVALPAGGGTAPSRAGGRGMAMEPDAAAGPVKRAGLAVAALAAALSAAISSCDCLIYDAMEPCQDGVSVRFVFDWNMEFANAFPSNVDCLTLHAYDGDGNFVSTWTETSGALADEGYRMALALSPGDYHLVAYGGISCGAASFRESVEPGPGSTLRELGTFLPTEGGISRGDLHGFFFGDLDIKVTPSTGGRDEATVHMMRNTNNVRVILQQMSGDAVDDSLFDFRIVGDNTRFDHANDIVPEGETTYLPWARGQRSAGTGALSAGDVVVAYAEFSTSRLAVGNSPRLVVTRAADGVGIIDIPLTNYLLLARSDRYGDMPDQEFLDRQGDWSLLFLLDERGDWLRTWIVVNDWVVRMDGLGF